jgi:hypothetical protein
MADGALDEEKPPAVDALLAETEHILVDYMSLLPKDGILTAGPTQAGKPREGRLAERAAP